MSVDLKVLLHQVGGVLDAVKVLRIALHDRGKFGGAKSSKTCE